MYYMLINKNLVHQVGDETKARLEMLGSAVSYGAHNLKAPTLEYVKKVVPWDFFSLHSMWLLPIFFGLLLTELLHFISLEMTGEFESTDANKRGFLIIVSFITSLSSLYASYVTNFVRPGWKSLQCAYC
jgi:hypothetical protein